MTGSPRGNSTMTHKGKGTFVLQSGIQQNLNISRSGSSTNGKDWEQPA